MSLSHLTMLDEPGALRRIHPGEAPYPGRLHATDPPTVWVDIGLVDDVVWRCDPEGHLLAPIDVARTRDGHAAIVPHCSRRLAGAVAGCSPGAAVTAAVSILRAASEARAMGIEHGSWWIDAAGRPVLAATGAAAWTDEAVAILDALAAAAAGRLAIALDAAARLVERRRMPRDEMVLCEGDLFDAAEPETLAVRDQSAGATPVRAAALRRDAVPEPVERHWAAQFVDSEWAERLVGVGRSMAAVPGALRERFSRAGGAPGASSAKDAERPPRARRGRKWAFAAAAAVVVIVAGLMWPDTRGADAPAAAQTPGASPGAATPAPASSTKPADGADAGLGSDLETAARDIVETLSSCAASSAGACGAVMEDPAAGVEPGAVTSLDAAVTLLDEYGGVAVFRVESEAKTPQILVLVSVDGTWLVRDVYDFADQQ